MAVCRTVGLSVAVCGGTMTTSGCVEGLYHSASEYVTYACMCVCTCAIAFSPLNVDACKTCRHLTVVDSCQSQRK